MYANDGFAKYFKLNLDNLNIQLLPLLRNTKFLSQNVKLFEVHYSNKVKFIFQMKFAIAVVVACCVGRQGDLVWWLRLLLVNSELLGT